MKRIGRHNQQGAALIVTMIILIVVTVIGVAALRLGLTNLAVATNAQVVTLLFQSADSGTLAVEKNVQALIVANPTQPTGLLKTAMDNAGKDMADSCMLASNSFSTGRCDVTSATNFMSGRAAVAVQSSIFALAGADGTTPMQVCPDGTDNGPSGLLCAYQLKVYSTAVLPSMGSASTTTINGCLGKTSDNTQQDATITTLSDCLSQAGAAYATTVQEYGYGYKGK